MNTVRDLTQQGTRDIMTDEERSQYTKHLTDSELELLEILLDVNKERRSTQISNGKKYN